MRHLGFGPDVVSLRDAQDIERFIHDAYGGRIDTGTEFFMVIPVDANFRPLRAVVIAEGEADNVSFYYRDLSAVVAKTSGRHEWVILAHNHPSGKPAPSKDDLYITTRIVTLSATEPKPWYVWDHVIVTAEVGVFASTHDNYPNVIPRTRSR